MKLMSLLKPNIILLFCLLCIAARGYAFDFANKTSPPLHPSEAFQLLASFSDPNTVRIEYSIAEGYYLYHSRFKFSTDSPEYTLGEPVFSESQTMEDEYFGTVQTYSHQAIIEIPVEQSAADKKSNALKLQVTSQGCAAIAGICYQPYVHTVELPPSL